METLVHLIINDRFHDWDCADTLTFIKAVFLGKNTGSTDSWWSISRLRHCAENVAFIRMVFLGKNTVLPDSWWSISRRALCRNCHNNPSSIFRFKHQLKSWLMTDVTARSVYVLLHSTNRSFSVQRSSELIIDERGYTSHYSHIDAFFEAVVLVLTCFELIICARSLSSLHSHTLIFL